MNEQCCKRRGPCIYMELALWIGFLGLCSYRKTSIVLIVVLLLTGLLVLLYVYYYDVLLLHCLRYEYCLWTTAVSCFAQPPTFDGRGR